jgi:hypothetical protein
VDRGVGPVSRSRRRVAAAGEEEEDVHVQVQCAGDVLAPGHVPWSLNHGINPR